MSSTSPLRIGFLGTPDFAAACLTRLIASDHQVVGVVTAPDRPAGRGHKLQASAVKQVAMTHQLPLLQPEKLRDPTFLAAWDEWQVDVGVVVAFRMMPEVLWNRPRLGTINLHASLLPQLRGAAPIQRAIMAGLTETGVTTFRLSHEIDTGDMLGSAVVSIGPDMDAGQLHDALLEAGQRLLVSTLDGLAQGSIVPIPQQTAIDADEPLLEAPKLFKADTRIDWHRPASDVHNHVRGLHPWPGAWTASAINLAQTIKIHSGQPAPWTGDSKAAPGSTSTGDNGHLLVRCSQDAFKITRMTPPGKKPMDSADWLRGLPAGTLPSSFC